jgi:hypothetical protein
LTCLRRRRSRSGRNSRPASARSAAENRQAWAIQKRTPAPRGLCRRGRSEAFRAAGICASNSGAILRTTNQAAFTETKSPGVQLCRGSGRGSRDSEAIWCRSGHGTARLERGAARRTQTCEGDRRGRVERRNASSQGLLSSPHAAVLTRSKGRLIHVFARRGRQGWKGMAVLCTRGPTVGSSD